MVSADEDVFWKGYFLRNKRVCRLWKSARRFWSSVRVFDDHGPILGCLILSHKGKSLVFVWESGHCEEVRSFWTASCVFLGENFYEHELPRFRVNRCMEFATITL